MGCYILTPSGEVRRVEVEVWARWFSKAQRHVRKFRLGGLYVSTVFLGLDHNYEDDGLAPVLWETMIFLDSWDDEWCERYTSRWAAEDGHDWAILVGVTMLCRMKIKYLWTHLRAWLYVRRLVRNLSRRA